MKISLIIPAHNEEKFIGICIEYALKNSHNKIHEIIVVDNASSDQTSAVAMKYPLVRVVRELQKGTNRARQKGLDEATGDILAFIDADSQMPEGWIEKIEQTFSRDSHIVSLSGPYKYYDGTRFHRGMMAFIWWMSAPIMYAIVSYMVLGGNFAARKDTLIKMGGFNSSITFYGDDTDIARRLHHHGKVVFRMDFVMYSSMRRIIHQGILKANILYGLNYIWVVLFNRPFTK
jgi:glycosyltransferase involved in cell wall biosynthesis